jgi:hypothetical protein
MLKEQRWRFDLAVGDKRRLMCQGRRKLRLCTRLIQEPLGAIKESENARTLREKAKAI